MRITKNCLFLLSVFLLAITLCACGPRGDTASLDETLKLAKERYGAALASSQSKVDEDTSKTLADVVTGLDRICDNQNKSGFTNEASGIAKKLSALVTRAGYTSRSSLDELVKIYESAGSSTGDDSYSVATGKLLAQRTYHALASELEATHFAVS